ncbi:MAG: cytochrome c [Candidatus Marinimicrobia bacterium]|jgi:mono/diheme cytochrome c family protein|nr:cytochrome c [Candidatus Neomarinimicrobiota bacterium]MBT5176008.1 cytochrome c [Candidatus Neomarinimicrobiota bacterium]
MNTLKVILFTFLVVGFYSFYANSIPQTESHPPKKISLNAKLSEDEMIEAGERVYSTKGTCGICHAIGRKGSRGPDLNGVGLRAASRKPDVSAKTYLLESLLKPSAYLVEDYAPMMPPMAGILTPGEVMVTVAYLQSLGGKVDITPEDVRSVMQVKASQVSVVPEAVSPASVIEEPVVSATASESLVGDPEKGKAVYNTLCIACHNPDPALAGTIGPEIKGASRDLLEARILRAEYPQAYQPKRDTKIMPSMAHLANDIENLTEFLK